MAAQQAASAAVGGGALSAIGAIGAVFGIAGAISQFTTARRAAERANEEAAAAVAQARDRISKMPVLEKGIPTIQMEQVRKDALRQRKQLIDAVRGSGQRAVIGGVPTIGEQILTEQETVRGETEKQLQAREDEIVKAEEAKQDLELQMLTATGAAARQRAAAAAQQGAAALGSAGKSVASLGASILEGSDLFGAEKRQTNRALKGLIGDRDDVDIDQFSDYVTNITDAEGITLSQEQLMNTINDPDNTLLDDFLNLQGKGLDVDTGLITGTAT